MSSVAAAGVEAGRAGVVRDLVALTKPRITAMVVFTTAGGLWVAPNRLPLVPSLAVVVATAMVVSAANALNCWLERDFDALMNRTRRRPLAAGRLSPGLAVAFALGLAAVSLSVLTFAIEPLAGLLAFIALVSYVWIYTPMKRMSSDSLLVGAVPGALPPLIGYAAATGTIDLPGIVLFSILFVWQLPHFLAISILCRDDYARAGYRVFSVSRGEEATKRWTVAWAVAQLAVSLLVLPLGMAGWLYGIVATVAGVWFLADAVYGLRHGGLVWARRMMRGSLLYLAAIFTALMVGA
ncbi:heme o synthase [Vulgatibacter incomptus]|uniref:Protoheme IX farnesyltransferase n=1 Tax=Vulgatibacter incomptus TaxID=1391653 RepID=A0A0K1PD56_9BACT|nr:heme o synthase [Vulgatibacter incomptus]AKU91054.1 Heme O synthase, protoheme IX farnesyltransferase [Vulgatibacter incomptus]